MKYTAEPWEGDDQGDDVYAVLVLSSDGGEHKKMAKIVTADHIPEGQVEVIESSLTETALFLIVNPKTIDVVRGQSFELMFQKAMMLTAMEYLNKPPAE